MGEAGTRPSGQEVIAAAVAAVLALPRDREAERRQHRAAAERVAAEIEQDDRFEAIGRARVMAAPPPGEDGAGPGADEGEG